MFIETLRRDEGVSLRFGPLDRLKLQAAVVADRYMEVLPTFLILCLFHVPESLPSIIYSRISNLMGPFFTFALRIIWTRKKVIVGEGNQNVFLIQIDASV